MSSQVGLGGGSILLKALDCTGSIDALTSGEPVITEYNRNTCYRQIYHVSFPKACTFSAAVLQVKRLTS